MRKLILSFLAALALMLNAAGQDRVVTGRVTDEKGNPLERVSVTVTGTKEGTFTKSDGTFSISASAASSLIFTDVNYERLVLKATSNNMTVVLKMKNILQEEVIVTGYTNKKRSEFTGAASKVSAKQIEQVPLASFEQILQGKAPGLYIASGSGQPGTAARVNIRGVGSISGGSNPLYVLDGVPIENAVFRSLNPNDFESVDVLKDAASAGLYGSRGANGVIVITSKKGKSGKTLIQYRGQMGYSEPPSLRNVRLMNTEERLRYEEEFLGPSGVIAASTATGYPGWDYSPTNPAYQASTPAQKAVFASLLDSIKKINTNWADILFRRAQFKQHELNASGGSQNLTFYTSLSAFQQEGVLDRSGLDRYTFRGNIDFKADRLTASIRSTAGFSSQSGIESEAGVALANPIAAAFLELPYRALYKSPGVLDLGAGKVGPNAYDRTRTTTSKSDQFKGGLAITLQYNLWKGLSLKTTNGVDYRNNNASRFIDPNSFVGGQVAQGQQGSYNESFVENVQFISTSGLVFSRLFNNAHQVNVLAMSESIRNKARTFTATGFGINRVLPNTPSAITAGSPTNNFIPLIGGNKFINGISSLFAAGDYTYKKRYTVSASVRRDVTSQVPDQNKDIVLSTVGVGWNLMEENFMRQQGVFQDARIRASIGESANLDGFTSEFGFIPNYTSGSYAGVPAIVPNSPGNLDYRIESQVLTNVGFDVSVWNRRVRISVDAYKKESENLFVAQGLSRTTGFTGLSTNAGKMENKGLDFSVNVDVINKSELKLILGINGGFLKNEITDLGQVSEIPAGTGIIRVGVPFGTHFNVGYKGINPQTGLPVYEDINGNPTTDYSAANNRAAFGTYLPAFTGGATADIYWKGFEISMLFSTAQGVDRFNNESFFYQSTNANIQYNKDVRMLNSWRNPGDVTNYQKINSARQFSSKDIQDASFVRFRNLQAGYTFNTKAGKPIRSFKLWGQAQNLYTWTKWSGFDPEESNNIATYEFPNPRTFTIGLDLNF
jgi:TonB-linked SusC/RagA family outer membrane protein